jgi:hypothetical protein
MRVTGYKLLFSSVNNKKAFLPAGKKAVVNIFNYLVAGGAICGATGFGAFGLG